jgi:NADH pyrophosphatase NudC (nudix superfamily)
MPGEGTVQALTREVKEESGQTITKVTFIAAFYSKKHYSIALCFHASLEAVQALVFNPTELTEVGFFDLKRLPEPMSPRYKHWFAFYRERRKHGSNILNDYD